MTEALNLSRCPFCGGYGVVTVTTEWPDYTPLKRLDDYGDNGADIESYVFCDGCGARSAKYATSCFDSADYDDAVAGAVKYWETRTNPVEVADNIKNDARRYRRLLHQGLRFMIGGVLHKTKEATDAAIDALPDPPPGSASRM